jgi:long-chain acyl-CoA synthetase
VQQALAERLVFSAIKARMGGKIRFFMSGSAGLNREVQEWFYAAGLLLLEGYGLTETSSLTCVNNPRAPRFGTVGPPIPGTELKIAEDGEIMVKGPGVLRGYHHLPEASAEAVVDGWFATGDIGELDDHGYLKITDRKKDLIKTSGGKYVAPAEVEGVIKAACPYVSQVVAHGEGRKYISALIALDPDAIKGWADGQGLTYGSTKDLTKAPEVRALIESCVQAANRKLERWETVKRWAFLPGELDVEHGEVTPSMKVRRSEVTRRYSDLLDSLYDRD